jgi:TRAP-type C4-dicarboxylate transport system permease small subunit
MKKFIYSLTGYMTVAAGVILIFMAILTFADIVMRYFGRPIPGVYEVVAFLGIAVAGFVLPRYSLMKAHVAVDFVVEKLSTGQRMMMNIVTRVMAAFFFFVASWFFVGMAKSFIATNSVTMTLKIPFYPVVYMLAFSFFVQGVVMVYQIFEKKSGGRDE